MENSQFIIIVAIILFFVIKKLGQVSAAKAKELLASGALIIDVRTPEEFAGDHLEGAINLPLDSIGKNIESVCADKSKPLLLYCLSGTRSGFAARIIKSRQYTQVFNLGSIFRARSILK